VRFIPACLSCLLLTAHFLRWGSFLGILACLSLPPLALLVRRRWTLRVLQGFLILGSLLWIWIAFRIAGERAALEAPYFRMALILGAVAAFTAWSAWFLQGAELLRAKRT